jgi:hypothetical protein
MSKIYQSKMKIITAGLRAAARLSQAAREKPEPDSRLGGLYLGFSCRQPAVPHNMPSKISHHQLFRCISCIDGQSLLLD